MMLPDALLVCVPMMPPPHWKFGTPGTKFGLPQIVTPANP